MLLVVFTIIAAELLLQAGALVVRDRSETATESARVKIVGVGDSHMFGAMVEEDESFPAQLGAALNENDPGHYALVNLGVPGMSTTQVRNRFVDNLALYQPDLVLIWCGINNQWNRSELDSKQTGSRTIEAYAQRSRLYRMYRVWRHNREIDEGVRSPPAQRRDEAAKFVGDQEWAIRHSGREEVLEVERFANKRETAQVRAHAYRDFLDMAKWAQAAGVKVVFIGYPVQWGHFAAANFAMQDVAAETGASYIPTKALFEALSGEDAKLLPGAHPTAAMYRAFAVAAAPTIRELVE